MKQAEKTVLLGWLISMVAIGVAVITDFIVFQITGSQDLIAMAIGVSLGIGGFVLADYFLRIK